MPLVETPPESVLAVLQARGSLNGHAPVRAETNGHKPDDGGQPGAVGVISTDSSKPRLSIAADLDRDGNYGRRWLVVDQTHLRVISVTGEKKTETSVVDLDLPLTDIVSTSTDSLVGCGVLLVHTREGTVLEALRYTVGLSPRFSTVSRVIDGYLKDEEPSEDLLDGLDQSVCPKCGDPLPDDSKICVKCIDKRAVLWRLARYCKPYLWQNVLVMMLTIVGTMVGLLPPIFQRNLTDDVLVPHRHGELIGPIMFGVLAVNAVSIVLSIWRGRIAAYISNHMVYALRTQAYERLQQQSVGYYDKRQTGSLTTRVTQDVNDLQSFMVDGIQIFVVNILQIIGIFVILFLFNWQLTLLVLIPLPVTVIIVQRTFRLLFGRLHRLYYLRSSLGAIITATLSGVRVVKAFAQEARETERFRERAGWLFDAGVSVEQSWATYFPILNFITTLGVYIIWYAGGLAVFANTTNMATHGRMTIGMLMMFLTYTGMVLAPIQGMMRIADWLSRAVASAERVFEVLDSEPDVANITDPVRIPRIEGRVELRSIRFSYDKSHDVLEDVSVLVEPGEMIGLVGHSGAGKSTLINLLSRFYDVREGQILIDGVDIRRIDLGDLRRQIGVVLQEPFLFPGTIAENIAYARPDATPEDIMQAAKAANAHAFVMRFPDGYDTYVGERGARLSGGERQRISIARAILHDPRILILDEATASVDTETEKQIQEAMQRLVRGRTTFAIAHRLSTLRHADRLMVIERGKLVELGTHDELLARPEGVFRKLVDMQKQVNELHAEATWQT